MDSVIHVLNNWVHLPLLLVSLFGTCTVKLARESDVCLWFKMLLYCEQSNNIKLKFKMWRDCLLPHMLPQFAYLCYHSDCLQSPLNREKSLCHTDMVAKFVDDNNPKIHLTSKFALFQTSLILFNFI